MGITIFWEKHLEPFRKILDTRTIILKCAQGFPQSDRIEACFFISRITIFWTRYKCVFQINRRLEDHVFTLQDVLSLQSIRQSVPRGSFMLSLMAKWYPRQILYLVLGSLYKEVGSRAFFGDYESDWLSQDYGGKQSCAQHCFRLS